VPLTGEKVENSGVKSSPGRRLGCGYVVFKIQFYFSLLYSDLIGAKLLAIKHTSTLLTVLPMMVIGE